MSAIRSRPVAVLATAAMAAACTSAPPAGPDDPAAAPVVVSIDNEPDALAAMADTLSSSLRWTGQLDITVDRDEVDQAAATYAEQVGEELDDVAEQQLDELSDYADRAKDHTTHGALADDGSWQVAVAYDEATWLDLRWGLGEVLYAETMTPDAEAHVQVDWSTFTTMLSETTDDAVLGEVNAPEMLRQFAQDPQVPDDLVDVILALADGSWAGLAGTLDLTEFGVTEAQLDTYQAEFEQEFAGLADRATQLDLADEALTVRDYTAADGGLTVATVDVHPRDAAFAIYDLFDDAAALGTDVADARSDAESLPETLEAVATVTFDDAGRLVEVRTDVIAIAAAAADAEADRIDDEQTVAREGENDPLAELSAYNRDPEDLRAAADMLRGLEATSAAVVFGFSDHGDVPTVLDVGSTTGDWGELTEFFFGGLYGTTPPSGPEETATPGPQTPSPARTTAESAVRDAATWQEMYFTDHHNYATFTELKAEGMTVPDGVELTVALYQDRGAYCVQATHVDEPDMPVSLDMRDGFIVGDSCEPDNAG